MMSDSLPVIEGLPLDQLSNVQIALDGYRVNIGVLELQSLVGAYKSIYYKLNNLYYKLLIPKIVAYNKTYSDNSLFELLTLLPVRVKVLNTEIYREVAHIKAFDYSWKEKLEHELFLLICTVDALLAILRQISPRN